MNDPLRTYLPGDPVRAGDPVPCPACGKPAQVVGTERTRGGPLVHCEDCMTPMPEAEGEYPCPRCVGTGSLESSDSTDDRWWDCPRCQGTGKLADRRRP